MTWFELIKHCAYALRLYCVEMAAKPVCVLFYLLLASGVVSGFTPVTYPVSSECGQYDLLQDQQLMETLGQVQQQLDCHPPKNRSCHEILHCFPSAPSGYYQIRVPNGSLVQVYCDMEGTNCGGEGGWMRVAYVNMSQSGATCPQGLIQTTLSGLTLCGRNGSAGCQSTVFSTLGLNYSQVCGQLRGYQRGAPDAFRANYINPSITIDSVYVDGVSITYSSAPRKHIWTYANGLCILMRHNIIVPATMVIHTCLPHLLAVTTTVRLVTMIKLAVLTLPFTPMTHCGMGSNVLVRRLPAVLTPTCRGSTRHSMRPPLRTLN